MVDAQYSGDISYMALDCYHVVAAPNIPDVGAAMAATFRFVTAYNRCDLALHALMCHHPQAATNICIWHSPVGILGLL